MWLLAQDIVVQSTSNTTAYIVAGIAAVGAVTASLAASRHRSSQPPTGPEKKVRRRLDKERRQVPLERRIGRIESWKEQKVDPHINKVENVLDWPHTDFDGDE